MIINQMEQASLQTYGIKWQFITFTSKVIFKKLLVIIFIDSRSPIDDLSIRKQQYKHSV